MKKPFKQVASVVLAAISAVTATTTARADDLTYVGKDKENSEYYLDVNTLRQEPSGWIRYVTTVKLNPPSPKGVLYIDFDSKGHCPSNMAGVTNVQAYNVNDQLVEQKMPQEITFDKVSPGSMEELSLDAACRVLGIPR